MVSVSKKTVAAREKTIGKTTVGRSIPEARRKHKKGRLAIKVSGTNARGRRQEFIKSAAVLSPKMVRGAPSVERSGKRKEREVEGGRRKKRRGGRTEVEEDVKKKIHV